MMNVVMVVIGSVAIVGVVADVVGIAVAAKTLWLC